MPYSPEEKQRALDRLRANGGSAKQTSRETGISARTLRRWRDAARKADPAANDGSAPLPDDVLGALETHMATHALTLAEQLLDENQPAPLNQRTSALSMLVDKLLKLDARRADAAPANEPHEPIEQRIAFRDLDGTVYGGGDDAG